MKNIVKFIVIFICLASCKTNYTGFNTISGKSHQIKLKPIEVPNTPKVDPVYASNTNDYLPNSVENETILLAEFSSKIDKANVKTENTTKRKISFKEKVVTKLIEKKMAKTKSMNNNKPDGFNNLDGKLKIGLILLAVAIALSILGFGQLAGLAGLIGLIFLVIGLLNTYN
jgi:hypothetical protein